MAARMTLTFVVPSSVFLNPIAHGFGILRPLINYPPAKFNRYLTSHLHSINRSLPLHIRPPPSSITNKPSSSFGDNAEASAPPPTSAYIHLPFCRKRCFYCDFTIVALGTGDFPQNLRGSQHDPRMENYTNLLCKEITAMGTASIPSAPLETVFFGGGTPSLMPASLLSSILECLKKQFGLKPTSEISIEMDPGTFNAETLREFMDLGINRVSLGVQAFQENLLRSCGRAHGLAEVYEAIEILHSSGLQNWSLDLISSLPHQTVENWEQSLEKAVASGPAHVSIYDLQVEEGTKFGLWYKPGVYPLPSEDNSAEFYKMASQWLREAGYGHYEISNYAKEGFECRHNLVYWQNLPYYGFGLGATSYVGGLRFSRPRRMSEYSAFVEELEASGKLQEGDAGVALDSRDVAMDTVMLSLRLASGLDIQMFSRVFGQSLCMALCRGLKPFVGSGHLIVLNEEKRPLSAEIFDYLCSGSGQEEISPQNFSRRNIAEEDDEPFYRDGQSDLDEVEESLVNGANQVAFIRLSDPEGFLLSNELISTAFSAIST